MFAKLAVITALASLAVAEETCLTPPTRSGPGRDVSFGNSMCSDQISNCAALCNDQVSANTCTSNNEGVDNPFRRITYCFDCTCADGSTPNLEAYLDTIPNEVCQRGRQNCYYSYNQVGQTAPDGECDCGDQYAVEPSWWSLIHTPTSTYVAAAETTTSPAEAEVTTSTSTSETETTTSTSTSAPLTSTYTTSSSSVAETGSFVLSQTSTSSNSSTTTVQLSTTVRTSTTSSSSSSHHSSTTSTTSVAPVKSAAAAMLEPAVAIFGMGLAAVMAL